MLNRQITFLEKNSNYNNFISGPSLEEYLSEKDIPSLVNVIAQARAAQEKINTFKQKNPECYKIIFEGAQALGLSINEESKIVLCRISLEADGGDNTWHDYFSIEDSIGYDKGTHLAKMNLFKLDIDYQVKVAMWFQRILLPNLGKIPIIWNEEKFVPYSPQEKLMISPISDDDLYSGSLYKPLHFSQDFTRM